jgi:transcription initiation factor TFIIIB Brf1 subunit/transcription initiation factor TFIIB
MHRRAAISLNMEREWAYIPQRMVDCPACGEKVKPGVAVCRHCGAVLDAEKAAKHGLGTQPLQKMEESKSPREGKGTK